MEKTKKQDPQLASIIYSFEDQESYNRYLSDLQRLKQISVEVVKNPATVNCLKLSYNGEILPVKKGVMNGNCVELDIEKHSDISLDEISKTGAFFCTSPYSFCRTSIIFQFNEQREFIAFFTFSAADFINDFQNESPAHNSSLNFVNNCTSLSVEDNVTNYKSLTLPNNTIYRVRKDNLTEMRSYKYDGKYLVLSIEKTNAKTFGEFVEEIDVIISVIAANACDSYNK